MAHAYPVLFPRYFLPSGPAFQRSVAGKNNLPLASAISVLSQRPKTPDDSFSQLRTKLQKPHYRFTLPFFPWLMYELYVSFSSFYVTSFCFMWNPWRFFSARVHTDSSLFWSFLILRGSQWKCPITDFIFYFFLFCFFLEKMVMCFRVGYLVIYFTV